MKWNQTGSGYMRKTGNKIVINKKNENDSHTIVNRPDPTKTGAHQYMLSNWQQIMSRYDMIQQRHVTKNEIFQNDTLTHICQKDRLRFFTGQKKQVMRFAHLNHKQKSESQFKTRHFVLKEERKK